MTQNVLPGLNYDATLASEDYKTYRDMVESFILERFLLSTGSPPNTIPQTGIVDFMDPSQISSTETTRPFLVKVSTLDPLKVSINAGYAVTPTGAVINSLGNFSFSLYRSLANDVNVIFVENEIIAGGDQPLNDYNTPLNTLDVQNPDNLRVALMADWNNTSLYPQTRKNNIVVLAVVEVVPTVSGGLELQIDMSQNTYSYVRPWFSIQDIQHRSKVGSGTVTDRNPHGTSVNDLTVAGSVSLFQGLSETGLVVSRDRVVNKMTGAIFCTENIPLNRLQTDTTGLITAKSKYGRVNAQYVELLSFPTRVSSLYVSGNQGNSVAGEVIDQTNILVFANDETLDEPLTIEYTQTAALLPPVTAPTNLLTFGVPSTDEVIVANGITFDTVADPTYDMEGSGPFPRRYEVFQLGNGSLTSFPQILVPATLLNDVGTSLYQPAKVLQYPCRIGIGLTKANQVSTMSVDVEIFGTDVNDTSISEIVTISVADGYVDETVPSTNYDSPNQIFYTDLVFKTVSNIQVLNRTNDGPLTTLQIWGEIEAATAPDTNDLVAITELLWNGQGIAQILDSRLISKGYFKPDFYVMKPIAESSLDANMMLAQLTNPSLLNQVSTLMMTEDFEDLKHFETVRGRFTVKNATGSITIQNNGLIAANDTIALTPSKTLKAVSATPNVASGEFQIGVTASATVANIIATINDPTFASGITAVTGSGFSLTMTRNTPTGAAGNDFTITKTMTIPSSIDVSGWEQGFDAIGECYMNRNVLGLRSTRIPPSSDLSPYGFEYRNRYRCRAQALGPTEAPQTLFAVSIHGEDLAWGSSVRIRGATAADPGEWLPWMVLTNANPSNVYIATFSEPVYKVQVEYYGKARGLSIYNLKPNI